MFNQTFNLVVAPPWPWVCSSGIGIDVCLGIGFIFPTVAFRHPAGTVAAWEKGNC